MEQQPLNTALIVSAMNNDIAHIRRSIELGADPNAEYDHKNTALIMATKCVDKSGLNAQQWAAFMFSENISETIRQQKNSRLRCAAACNLIAQVATNIQERNCLLEELLTTDKSVVSMRSINRLLPSSRHSKIPTTRVFHQ